MFGILNNSARSLESIDERLMQCGVSRRSFLQFCSSLMVAAPFGLAITDKKTPEEVAAGIGKVIRPPVVWLHFQDCTGCTETLLRPSHPDLGDLILNVISLEYHETQKRLRRTSQHRHHVATMSILELNVRLLARRPQSLSASTQNSKAHGADRRATRTFSIWALVLLRI